MDIIQSLQNIIRAESEAILAIPVNENYAKAVEAIIEHVHHRGGKVVTSGMGKAGQIAVNIATTFASTGTPAMSIHPSEAQHGDLGVLQPNDIMVLISNSGRTVEMLQLVELARRLYPEMKFIVITGDTDSELARKADIILSTGNVDEICPLGLTPTTSITMMTVIGHMLVIAVMNRIGFTREQYAMRHQGGNLGEKLRNSL